MTEPTPRHPEAAEFVQWLYARTGAKTVGEFAELVGEPDRKIYRWLAGENAPRFESAVKMMRAAGVLDMEAPLPPTITTEIAELRESIGARLDELVAALLVQPEGPGPDQLQPQRRAAESRAEEAPQ